ncbi:MAG: phasin family protein [Chloroflexia bacterium]
MSESAPTRRRKARAPEQPEKELFQLTRRVLLAGVGAAALAYDEASAFLNRLVERGELAEEQARKLLREVRERRGGQVGKVRSRLHSRLSEALQAVGVPTRADLEALEARLDRLTERLEALLGEKREA